MKSIENTQTMRDDLPAANNSDLVADVVVNQEIVLYYNVSQDTMSYYYSICRLHIDSCLYAIYMMGRIFGCSHPILKSMGMFSGF